MDCHEFRDIAADLARSLAREQTQKEPWEPSALAHAAECEACGRLLAAEERLAAGLSAIQARDEELQAPAHLEAALLEQFRALQRTVPVAPAGRLGADRRWWAVAAVAAAAMLAVWATGTWRRQPAASRDTIALAVPGAMVPPGAIAPPGAGGGGGETSNSNSANGDRLTADSGSPAGTGNPRSVAGSRSSSPAAPRRRAVAKSARRTNAGALHSSSHAGGASSPAVDTAQTAADAGTAAAGTAMAAGQQEVVTDFVPLTYGGWAQAVPEARLVRVRLPSTALVYFGFPAAAGSASVEADVLLGVDGLAHAVRFVRPLVASADLPERGGSGTPRRY